MPELPEVQTTVNGLQQSIVGLRITDVWSNYGSRYFIGSETIKDASYFPRFSKAVKGARVVGVSRRAKNVLVGLDNGMTILIHMKMTGHLLCGIYRFVPGNSGDPWDPISPPGLKDPYNRCIRFVLSFDNGRYLALSDVRRFAKVAVVDSDNLHVSVHLRDIGPEPLDVEFSFVKFNARLGLRPNGKIKQVLMDQSIVAGIGNIYADESLWRAGINSTRIVSGISVSERRRIFTAILGTLSRGIDFGGDSTSDYRNVDGEKGKFHESHHAYKRTGSKCDKKNCGGKIVRIMLGGRSTHFCDRHQK